MTDAALMMYGLYADKMNAMLAAQRKAPGDTFYVQPHSSGPIAGFLSRGPLVDPPTVMYASTKEELAVVSYRADIVGWRDKTLMDPDGEEFKRIDASIRKWKYNPGIFGVEEGFVNLIFIRNVVRLLPPFSVDKLIKIRDRRPLSTNKQMAGGWAYVYRKD
ncbi:MAG: hypothetical protein OXC27_12945 [Caldilineaceae bacterium]|nr:hypothetical protein [Caldilineaceae bacterium]